MNQITATQIVEAIYKTVNEDILTLNRAKPKFADDNNSYDFIKSLIALKIELKNTLPLRSEGNKEAVSTPIPTTIKSYADVEDLLFTESKRLAQICFEIESSQRKFLKKQYALKGIPGDIQEKLSKVLELYDHLFDHLQRSKHTDQLGIVRA